MRAVKAQAKYPSKADFDYLCMGTDDDPSTSGIIVAGYVDLMPCSAPCPATTRGETASPVNA